MDDMQERPRQLAGPLMRRRRIVGSGKVGELLMPSALPCWQRGIIALHARDPGLTADLLTGRVSGKRLVVDDLLAP